jgi:Flp pilus assembly protein TadG
VRGHIAFPEGVGFLKGIFRDIFLGRKGSVLIIVAVALVALLGIAALVVDAGLLYYTKVFLSNAADAAALAGVQELPSFPESAENTAMAYAKNNGVDETGVTAEVLADGRTIEVTTSKTVSLGFARVLGFSSTDVKASAKARVGTAKSAFGVVPFGVVWKPEFEPPKGQEVEPILQPIKYGMWKANEDMTPGNFGALALGGKGASVYQYNIENGYRMTLEIGDTVPTMIDTEPGKMAGPTKKGVNNRLAKCKHEPLCTIDCYVKGCPRFVIVPVVDQYTDPGRKRVKLRGFAAFLLKEVDDEGNVWGWFIRMATDGDLGNKDDYGVVSYRLEE